MRDIFFHHLTPEKEISSARLPALVASEMNKSLPIWVDKDTQLRSVSASDSEITYNFVMLNHETSQINQDFFLRTLTSTLLDTVCGDQKMQMFWKNNITAVYSYQDRRGDSFARIRVSPKDCGY